MFSKSVNYFLNPRAKKRRHMGKRDKKVAATAEETERQPRRKKVAEKENGKQNETRECAGRRRSSRNSPEKTAGLKMTAIVGSARGEARRQLVGEALAEAKEKRGNSPDAKGANPEDGYDPDLESKVTMDSSSGDDATQETTDSEQEATPRKRKRKKLKRKRKKAEAEAVCLADIMAVNKIAGVVAKGQFFNPEDDPPPTWVKRALIWPLAVKDFVILDQATWFTMQTIARFNSDDGKRGTMKECKDLCARPGFHNPGIKKDKTCAVVMCDAHIANQSRVIGALRACLTSAVSCLHFYPLLLAFQFLAFLLYAAQDSAGYPR